MRRIVLLTLTATLGGCGYNTWWNPPFTTGTNPNMPVTTSVNLARAAGQGVAVKPLETEPGDIWPGKLPPPISLQELSLKSPIGVPPASTTRGSPIDRANNPLLAPLPGGAGQPGSTQPGAAPDRGQPPADRRIIVPNGNGTSTVIHPDGRIETIPTPK